MYGPQEWDDGGTSIGTGQVQGVFFRESMRREAVALGVAGWVRNLPDGRVESLLEGTPAAVEQLLGWVWQGPPAARVDGVEAQPSEDQGRQGFAVLR